MRNLKFCAFGEINLTDKFFDSLKEDYKEFEEWFEKKSLAHDKAYVFYTAKNDIEGFLYLKIEEGAVIDIAPNLPEGKHLKVGTLKINPHGTRLGERFVKKILDHAVTENVDNIYLSVFAKHEALINLIKVFGFEVKGEKVTENGKELVLIRNMREISNDVLKDYPYILKNSGSAYLLAIWPQYHTKFLPDSKLYNESYDLIEDVSFTNSIHKVFISGVSGAGKLKPGDRLVIYRTSKGEKGKAYFRSVATSICVVNEVRRIESFKTQAEFIKYVKAYSVYSMEELINQYQNKKKRIVIKFTYNAALEKRIIRKLLLEEVGISEQPRWDFRKIDQGKFNKILSIGNLNENFVVN